MNSVQFLHTETFIETTEQFQLLLESLGGRHKTAIAEVKKLGSSLAGGGVHHCAPTLPATLHRPDEEMLPCSTTATQSGLLIATKSWGGARRQPIF